MAPIGRQNDGGVHPISRADLREKPRRPLTSTLSAMDFVVTVAAAIVAIVVLGAIVTSLLKLKLSRELNQKTRSELEQSLLRYEQDYFDYIGHEHPDVIAFKVLVETKDIKGIQEHWSRLSNSFVQLEWEAGRRGRPFIMDYYYSYEETLAALAKLGI